LSVSADAFHVGWIGRLSREKGPDVFLRSLSALSGEHVVASVVGDGPMGQELRLLAGELGLDGMVRWHGEVPDARKLMRAFDVVVLSSRSEGTPVVLLEAIDAGVPVIATRVGGVPDVISPREGILVLPEQPQRLGEALQQMMREPEEARERAQRAIRRIGSAGDTGRWIHRYEAVYREVLDKHQRNGVRS
jgi:glycosyltransferase involved in cell wall biosynthesis